MVGVEYRGARLGGLPILTVSHWQGREILGSMISPATLLRTLTPTGLIGDHFSWGSLTDMAGIDEAMLCILIDYYRYPLRSVKRAAASGWETVASRYPGLRHALACRNKFLLHWYAEGNWGGALTTDWLHPFRESISDSFVLEG